MSETTAGPAPSEGEGTPETVAPAPATQERLSVSEAARLLNKQRRDTAQQEGAPAPEAKAPADAAAKPAPKATKGSPLDSLIPSAASPQAAAAAAPMADGIEIDGKRYTPAQLKEALGKSEDYTFKSQQLSEQMRAVAAQQAAIQQVLPYIQPELAKLAQVINGVAQPDPALLESDPKRYFHELANYERAKAEQTRLFGVNQYQTAQQQQAFDAKVEEANQKLAEEFPFWAKPDERNQVQTEIVNWALTNGFTRDELRNLSDARVLKTLMKATQFDRMVNGARTTAPAPQMRAPVRGQPPPPAPSERVSTAQQRFDERPNIRSGAALLTARRANGGTPP